MPRRKKQSDDEDEEEYEVGTKKSKKERKSKKEKKSKKSKKSKKKEEDSSEEGQISDEDLFGENDDSTTASVSVPLKKRKNIQSDPQPSNDSDEEFHDGYDEDLMGDDEDRKYLMGLTEKQREEILLERYNRRKELQARWEMKKRLKASSGSTSATTTSSSSASTSPRRVPKRNKTTDTTKASAFSDLKKKRAKAYYDDDDDFDDEDQVESQDERDSDEDFVVREESSEKKTRSKRGSKSEAVSITVGPDSSSASASNNNKEEGGWGDDDNDEDNLEKPAKLENIIEICLSRDYLEKNLDNIHFDDFVRDFFVRVGIGKNNDKLVYRLAQIVGVKEGPKKYYVGKKSTSKLIILQHGTSTKSFSIEHVSNKPPTSSEFNRWYSESEKHDVPIPTRKQVKEKLDVKEALNNYIYTEEDIKQIVAKNKLNKMPVNVAAERLSLITLREAAQDINNTDEVEKLTKKIQELDKIALAQKKALENEKIIAINEKNKLTNQTQKYDSSANAAVSENDPFSRRHTKPSFPIFMKNQEENNNSSNESGNKEPETTSSKPEAKKEEIKKKEVDPSSLLKSAHDFELDLSSVGENAAASKSSAPINTNVVQNKRPTLSVNDYKVRRGLI